MPNSITKYGSEENQETASRFTKRQWKECLKSLKSTKAPCDALHTTCDKCFKHHSVLHCACRSNAPLFVVKRIYNQSKNQLNEPDCKKRLPLQVAIEHEAPLNVIAFLLKKNKLAAETVDDELNTPMHTALLGYRRRIGYDERYFHKFNYYLGRVISLLTKAVPSLLNRKNKDGLVPMELAFKEGCSTYILDTLWKGMGSKTKLDEHRTIGKFDVHRREKYGFFVYTWSSSECKTYSSLTA